MKATKSAHEWTYNMLDDIQNKMEELLFERTKEPLTGNHKASYQANVPETALKAIVLSP